MPKVSDTFKGKAKGSAAPRQGSFATHSKHKECLGLYAAFANKAQSRLGGPAAAAAGSYIKTKWVTPLQAALPHESHHELMAECAAFCLSAKPSPLLRSSA